MFENVTPVVALMSGGIDSSLMALNMSRHGFQVLPLFVDYGQRSARAEWRSCQAVSGFLRLGQPGRLSVPLLPVLRSLASQGPPPLWDNACFPHRNLFLMTLAGMYAGSLGVEAIAIGVIAGTAAIFPDTSVEYAQRTELLMGMTAPTQVVTPFGNWTKQEVIRYGVRHGFDFALTYSCTREAEVPCGRCHGCRERESLEDYLAAVSAKVR